MVETILRCTFLFVEIRGGGGGEDNLPVFKVDMCVG